MTDNEQDLYGAEIRGRLTSGAGKGQHFTRIDWARSQFITKLGIDPFPGTLNIEVDDPQSAVVWRRVQQTPGVRIANPNGGPRDCDGRCYRVSVESDFEAAIVLPEVPGYSPSQIEVIAAVNLRKSLGLNDGHAVSLKVKEANRPSEKHISNSPINRTGEPS